MDGVSAGIGARHRCFLEQFGRLLGPSLVFAGTVISSYAASEDGIPPIILQPDNIEIYAQTANAITEITFDVQATDDTDKSIQPICNIRAVLVIH